MLGRVLVHGSEKFDIWRGYLSQEKQLLDWPVWKPDRVVRERRKAAQVAGRQPLQSVSAERTQLLVQVMNTEGISIENVRVRIVAWTQRSMEDLTATFEVLYGQQWVCISRIDFAPPSPHTNMYWKKFGLPPIVKGSHIHPYEDNAKLGEAAFVPLGNLPIALPLEDELDSFRDILKAIEVHFRVTGLSELSPPAWTERLI